MHRKALITSLTLAATAGAISCTAASAAETPAQSESISVRDNGQPAPEQTRGIVTTEVVRSGEVFTTSPVKAKIAEEATETVPDTPDPATQTSAPEVTETPGEVEVPIAPEPEPTTPTPDTPGETEVPIEPSPEPTAPAPEDSTPDPGEADVPIEPVPEPSTPEPETPGEVEVPISPEPEPTTPTPDNPGDTDVPIAPEPEPTTPTPDTPGETEVPIEPSPEPTRSVTPSEPEEPDNSEVFSTEIPIAPEDAPAHSPADQSHTPLQSNSEPSPDAPGKAEVSIAQQAPVGTAPKKQSTTTADADAKSPSSVPATVPSAAVPRTELAYTGATSETPGITISGFLLVLIGAASVWVSRRKLEP